MVLNFSVFKIKSQDYKLMPTINIIYGRVETKYGKCIMALNEDKICFVSFGENDDVGISTLKKTFPTSNFYKNDELVNRKTKYFETEATGDIKLLLKGTEFELKTWEYLLSIKKGTTMSYEEVAKGIENPAAVRAVANAVAKNNIAFFVPCHRVISKNGNLKKYRWGPEIKLKMLHEEGRI